MLHINTTNLGKKMGFYKVQMNQLTQKCKSYFTLATIGAFIHTALGGNKHVY